jgi:septal ring factor EnvC (AmiA/AmiB activator)
MSRTKLNAATTELEELKKVTMTVDQKSKLEEENDKQAEEIKSLKAQLSDAQKDNNKLKGGIFSMAFEPSKLLILSRNSECYNAARAGLLTGRHEEEVSGF